MVQWYFPFSIPWSLDAGNKGFLTLSPGRTVPTVILGEHGGVKTMVWTVSSSQVST
jgi:hypothetical protein